MKIHELEIKNVRGIKEVTLRPDAKNFVVWGSNGSGKSAVVDAIDFLLTGRITRLTGKGTGDITLKQHGPHIDCDPESSYVKGIVQLPGSNELIELQRCMANPAKLECLPDRRTLLKPILTIADRGQHVLTRREILRFITADGSTRAQDIQELLNIGEIEKIRKAFVHVQGRLKSELGSANQNLGTARGAITATAQISDYSTEEVLQVINNNRKILGGKIISKLVSKDMKGEIRRPAMLVKDKAVNVTVFEGDITNLRNVNQEENRTKIYKQDSNIRTFVKGIRADPNLLRVFSTLQLVSMGLDLIDETGNCPLCDTYWEPEELRKYLQNKLSTAEEVKGKINQILRLSEDLTNRVNTVISSLQKVISTTSLVKLDEELRKLQDWEKSLIRLRDSLSSPVEEYLKLEFESQQISLLLAPSETDKILSRILSVVQEKYPDSTPEQTAWDTLTRFEENIKALEKAENQVKIAKLSHQRSLILERGFEKTRDLVLGKLYADIKDRFVKLYREIHQEDEKNFDASIKPSGAALEFEVNFYGRGAHPPHALHSEGHQDSMGICLFLALSEQLTENLIDLIILDDVVMSVDVDHRRELCHLLSNEFPDRQFLITTHDKTWASQLKSEGVVTSKSTVEFFNWKIETGPQVNFEPDMWDRIEQDMQNNDVPAAAARLRRGSEQFFGMVCDSLNSNVIYKLNGRYELGDFLPSAMGQLRRLLKKAKSSAQSWGNKKNWEELNELDSIVGQIYKRTQAEQWAVNASVHYNNWADLTVKDFRPVADAFQDLYYLFFCSKCESMLRLATEDKRPVNVRCSCGNVNWNLVEKGKENVISVA